MDYFGRMVDEICLIWEEIDGSEHAAEGAPVLRALEKAMKAAVQLERIRTAGQAAAAPAAEPIERLFAEPEAQDRAA